jgi:hypothetical protein
MNYTLPAELQAKANESVWTADPEMASLFSDVFKDRNGCRPRYDLTVQECWNWLEADRAYYNSPEGLAELKREAEEMSRNMVQWQVEEVLEEARESNRVVDVTQIYGHSHWTAKELDHALNILAEHNKRVLATKEAPNSTFKLGELLKNINLSIG